MEWNGRDGVKVLVSVDGRGTVLQAARSRVRFPMRLNFFSLPNPSSRTVALGSTQPLTEIITRKLLGSKERPALEADNLTAICLENVGASKSQNCMGLHGLLRGIAYPTFLPLLPSICVEKLTFSIRIIRLWAEIRTWGEFALIRLSMWSEFVSHKKRINVNDTLVMWM
jgi:hypothetical protein